MPHDDAPAVGRVMRDELREKLRHLTRDSGPLGSAVCALLNAAEADVPVMVMPDESRAILDLLAQQEAPTTSEIDSLDADMEALYDQLCAEGRERDALIVERAAYAIEALEADRALRAAPAEATDASGEMVGWLEVAEPCTDPFHFRLDGPTGAQQCPRCGSRMKAAPASGEPSGAEAAVREAWRSVTDSLPKPGADVLVGYRNRAGHWRVVRAVYAAARSVVCTCERDGDCFCEMDDTGESWWPEGWYEIADNADDVNTWRIRGTVTHWMPLPTAPGEEEGAGE